MTLYLVQHGEALSKEQDPERRLSPAGIATVQRIAERAAARGLSVETIVHSGKARAAQTAELFAARLHPAGGVMAVSGLAPNDDPTPFAAGLTGEDRMVVGHLPFLERLAALLVAGRTEPPVCRFRNAWVFVLEPREDGGWVIDNILGE